MLFTRYFLEDQEDKLLASYGVRSRDSKGRKFNEPEPDFRTSYQRDRDRILHTTAFRRLEYKTQVFINYEGDYYRTRLTHTLEVAQIGRSIARSIGANEDLVEAICLAHDLGHPPFGHAGETALAKLMKDYGGFNHNNHSYKIVTELEKRYRSFDGLNLTWEVLEGIVKHETEYDINDAQEFNPELRGHLEAQIANAADELAYSAHDLDDGLRSGLLSPDMLQGIDLWEIILNKINLTGHRIDEIDRHEIIRHLIGMEINELLHHSQNRLNESGVKTVDELQRLPYNVIGFSEEMVDRNRQLKDFLFRNLYRQYRVMRMSVKAERIINALFEAYTQEPRILPPHIQDIIDKKSLAVTICDYIAGMTDRFAIDEHKKLFDPGELP